MRKMIHFGRRPYEAPEASLVVLEEEKCILSGDSNGGIDDLEEDEYNW